MAKQDPDLGRLLDAVRDALRAREHVAELARSIDAQVAHADANLNAAHDALDRVLLSVRAPVVVGLADSPTAEPVPGESEADGLRRKVRAGLIDEAPCTSRQLHEPHQWDDELGAVVCLGVQPEEGE